MARKRQAVREVRNENNRLVGKDVTLAMADEPAPSEEEVKELSVLFNKALARVFKQPEDRSFYRARATHARDTTSTAASPLG